MEKVSDIWSEAELAEKMGLPIKKEKSRVIGHWCTLGLKSFTIAERRFFLEKDITEFFSKQYKLAD